MARKVVFALLTTTVALLCVVALSRLAGHVEYPPDPLLARHRQHAGGEPRSAEAKRQYDALLFWRLRPERSDVSGRGTNALGLRGPEIPARKGDEFRVLSLGESSTYGWNVTYGGATRPCSRRCWGPSEAGVSG